MTDTQINYADARRTMVDCQIRPSDVTRFPILAAFLQTARECFVPIDKKPLAYMGGHLSLANGRVLLDPRIFAKMLEVLNIQKSEIVLDIACGLGYSCAILGQLAQAVVGVESDELQASQASERVMQAGVDTALILCRGLGMGAVRHGPYDVIIIQGGVKIIPPRLIAQLNDGGRICAIFNQGAGGKCRIGIKIKDAIAWRDAFDATAPILAEFDMETGFSF